MYKRCIDTTFKRSFSWMLQLFLGCFSGWSRSSEIRANVPSDFSVRTPNILMITSRCLVVLRLSLLWWSWWRSAGTRTRLPDSQRSASRRPWTRFRALWRKARSRERKRSRLGCRETWSSSSFILCGCLPLTSLWSTWRCTDIHQFPLIWLFGSISISNLWPFSHQKQLSRSQLRAAERQSNALHSLSFTCQPSL